MIKQDKDMMKGLSKKQREAKEKELDDMSSFSLDILEMYVGQITKILDDTLESGMEDSIDDLFNIFGEMTNMDDLTTEDFIPDEDTDKQFKEWLEYYGV